MADKEKDQEKDQAFTGSPEEQLPDLEAEKLQDNQKEQFEKEAENGNGKSESQ